MWRYIFLGLAMLIIAGNRKESDNSTKSDSKIDDSIDSDDTPEDLLRKQLDLLTGLKNVKKQN